MLIVGRHISEHLGQSGQHPSVASCPKVLLAAFGLVFGIDIFPVTEIESGFLIKHQSVGISEVSIKLIQVFHIAGCLIEFGEYGHHHIQGVSPPPEVVGLHRTFPIHHLDGPGNLVVIGVHGIHVEIGLEANLPVTEKHIVLSLTIVLVLPLRGILLACTAPFVIARPLVGELEPSGIACQFIGLHVSGKIGSIIPERPYLGLVVGLPVIVHFFHKFESRRLWFCFLCFLRLGISAH